MEFVISSIKTSTATVSRVHPEIIILRYDEEFDEESIETVKENLKAIFNLGRKGTCSCLIIPSKSALPDLEGRRMIEQELVHMPYVAVVLNGLAQKILMNFVARVIGRTKMRIFTDEIEGMNWLLEKIESTS